MKLTDAIPTPWKITDTGSAYRISDAHGRGVAWVYYSRNEAMMHTHLKKEDAVEVAKAIARLSREA
jgi:hypothetical protein